MTDDRIFASNNAIGRKFYVGNIIILIIVFIVTNKVFEKYIFPYTTDETYLKIAQCFSWVIYLIYVVTLFSLVDRRLYDICGTRDSGVYKNISGFLTFSIVVQLIALINYYQNIIPMISKQTLSGIGILFAGIYTFIMFILAFLKGKISTSSQTEEEIL